MKSLLSLVFFVIVWYVVICVMWFGNQIWISCGGGSSKSNNEISGTEEEKIQEIFNLYEKSYINYNAEELIKYLSEDSIEHYGNIIEHIKYSEKSEILRESAINQFMILEGRYLLSEEDINNITSEEYIVKILEKKKKRKEKSILKGAIISNIDISDSSAKANIRIDWKVAFEIKFTEEENNRKIDQTQLFEYMERVMKTQTKDSWATGKQFIFVSLQEKYPNIDENIYNPLLKK